MHRAVMRVCYETWKASLMYSTNAYRQGINWNTFVTAWLWLMPSDLLIGTICDDELNCRLPLPTVRHLRACEPEHLRLGWNLFWKNNSSVTLMESTAAPGTAYCPYTILHNSILTVLVDQILTDTWSALSSRGTFLKTENQALPSVQICDCEGNGHVAKTWLCVQSWA